MTTNLSPKALAIIRQMQQNEVTESVIYEKIAAFAGGEENKATLRRLSQEEKAHGEIWKRYTGLTLKPEKAKVMKYIFLARTLGFTFAVKLMEKGEEKAQDQPFKSRFLEMAGISISVAVVSFIVGVLAKQFLGVDL